MYWIALLTITSNNTWHDALEAPLTSEKQSNVTKNISLKSSTETGLYKVNISAAFAFNMQTTLH